MGFLSKEQIIAVNDLPFKDIDVPEWGGMVRIRTMTGGERDDFEASIYDTDGATVKINRKDFRAKLLARVITDESGKRLFTDKEIETLSGKSAAALNRLFTEAQEINGISKDAEAKIEKK